MQINGTSISFDMESLVGKCVTIPEEERNEWIERGVRKALRVFHRTREYVAHPIASGDSLVLIEISPNYDGGAFLHVTDCIRRRNAFGVPILRRSPGRPPEEH